MGKDVKPRRRYNSARRQAQARALRREIIEAARRLFLAHGYDATTMEMIAQEAGAAVQTVYSAFGTKRGVLGAVMDVSIAGDHEALTLAQRPQVEAIRHEPDPRRRLALFAGIVRQIDERTDPIDVIMRSAAAVDPEVARRRADIQSERHASVAELAEMLRSSGALRDGLYLERATDIIWALGSPEIYHLLVAERGWSPDSYERWLVEGLSALLLPPTKA